MSQKELASKILKEDGLPITPQYLNDIEHDRRSPSSDHLVTRFAQMLSLDREYLFFLAGRVSPEMREKPLTQKDFKTAMVAFRKSAGIKT